MKKFYLAIALFGLLCSSSSAQNKLSMADRAILNELRMPHNFLGQDAVRSVRTSSAGSESNVCAMVEIADGYTAGDLVAAGASVNTVIGNMATVVIPVAGVETFAANEAVARIQLDRQVTLNNDRARTTAKVNQVQGGLGLPQKYFGDGVIAGVFDVGIDVHHPAFKTDDLSASRIHRLYYLSDTKEGTKIQVYSGTGDKQTADGVSISDLTLFDTDDAKETHGTHTTATVAGGKGGSKTFYGMAPNADIALACGSSSLAAIVDGFAALAEYGLEAGKPVVINCSMGVSSGSHDGTDIFSQMIDRIVEKTNAIICLSAGNEGDNTIAWHHKFDKTEALTTGFQETTRKGMFVGTTEFWGNSADAFKVTISIGDVKTGKIIEELTTVDASTNGGMIYFGTADYAKNLGKINKSAAIDKYWTSAYYGIGGGVDENNGRFGIMLEYVFGGTSSALSNEDFRYVPVFTVEGNAGQEIWGYCSGRYEKLSARGVASWTEGTTNGSISNLACTKSVISVGAYVSRNNYTTVDGTKLGNNNKVGEICGFSSYGDIADGRSLPDVCAPGSFLISAISSPYWTSSANMDDSGRPRFEKATSAQYEAVNGRINAYGDMQGTSMSCPVVAGSIVLWKQANPDLTVEEARKVIKETATPVTSDNPTKWGAGKFDAIKGLKKVIEMANAGVDALEPDMRVMLTPIGNKSFEVYVAGETALNVTLYNMNGTAVMTSAVSGDTLTLDADALASGVYVLSIEGTVTHYSQRVLVK